MKQFLACFVLLYVCLVVTSQPEVPTECIKNEAYRHYSEIIEACGDESQIEDVRKIYIIELNAWEWFDL